MLCRFIRETMTMHPRCRTRIPVGYPANIHSDSGTGKGVLLDLSPTGCRMRSDIDLNAGAYLALEIAVAQEATPWRWKSLSYAGVKTATWEWSFFDTVRGSGNESQIFSPPRHRQTPSSILITPSLHSLSCRRETGSIREQNRRSEGMVARSCRALKIKNCRVPVSSSFRNPLP